MKKLLILLLLFSVVAYGEDESEVLSCATLSTPADWTEIVGSGCSLHEDANDATYIEETATGAMRYTLNNTAYSWDIIDSVVLVWRSNTKNQTKSALMYAAFIITDSIVSTTYQPPNIADSTMSSTTRPAGGAWTVTDINNLDIQFVEVSTAGGGGNSVHEFNVTMWGTQTVGAGPDPQILIYIPPLKWSELWTE
ncbi:MAG: hypothetical protein KAS32_21625 [Candidatus Peribacteraceae bacterium]|nr:hypothetical protein [Candidatus Peribacteraceae bacterium]